MAKTPTKGSAIIVKKVVGALLLIAGFVNLFRPEFIAGAWFWDVGFSFLILVAAYFLLIAGRQNK